MRVRAGWYELVGEEQVGKTTLAILIAKGAGDVLWLSAPQEDPSVLFACLGWEPFVSRVVERVDVAFKIMDLAQVHVDMVVLDSLAGLAPSHPGARHLAPDVARSWFEAYVPILVVNQLRHPHPPGGLYWRVVVESRTLSNVRRRPALYSRLDERWLVWWPGKSPELRVLEEDDYLWVPRGESDESAKVAEGWIV